MITFVTWRVIKRGELEPHSYFPPEFCGGCADVGVLTINGYDGNKKHVFNVERRVARLPECFMEDAKLEKGEGRAIGNLHMMMGGIEPKNGKWALRQLIKTK